MQMEVDQWWCRRSSNNGISSSVVGCLPAVLGKCGEPWEGQSVLRPGA